MAVKLSGADFKAFWTEEGTWFPLGNNGAVEEEQVFVNGSAEALSTDERDYPSQIADTDQIRVVGGYIDDYRDNSQTNLEPVLKAWMKRRNTVMMLVAVPSERVDEIAGVLKNLGVKVMS